MRLLPLFLQIRVGTNSLRGTVARVKLVQAHGSDVLLIKSVMTANVLRGEGDHASDPLLGFRESVTGVRGRGAGVRKMLNVTLELLAALFVALAVAVAAEAAVYGGVRERQCDATGHCVEVAIAVETNGASIRAVGSGHLRSAVQGRVLRPCFRLLRSRAPVAACGGLGDS